MVVLFQWISHWCFAYDRMVLVHQSYKGWIFMCRVLFRQDNRLVVFFVAVRWILGQSAPLDMIWTTPWCIITWLWVLASNFVCSLVQFSFGLTSGSYGFAFSTNRWVCGFSDMDLYLAGLGRESLWLLYGKFEENWFPRWRSCIWPWLGIIYKQVKMSMRIYIYASHMIYCFTQFPPLFHLFI